jgi:beta-lactamase regulating signal transducer with metallopeptidase domain
VVELFHNLTHFAAAASAGAAGTLIAAAWQGAVLVIAISLILKALPGIPASARSLIWTLALVLLIVQHFVPFFSTQPHLNHAVTLNSAMLQFDYRWTFAIAMVWVGISLWRAFGFVRSALNLKKLLRDSVPVAELQGEEFSALRAMADSELLCGGFRRAKLFFSSEIDRPSVVGYFAPAILFPALKWSRLDATLTHFGAEFPSDLQDSDLRQIVVHEMEHLRRGDDWVNLLQKLALVVFPLNPALLWVEKRLCVERELACDDRVMEATGNRKSYAKCLTNLAENRMVRRGMLLALGAWERQSELALRVYRILRGGERRMGTGRLRLVTGGLAVMLLAGTAELSRSPRLVGFVQVAPVRIAAIAPLALHQRLKPGVKYATYGTAEAVPLQSGRMENVVADVVPLQGRINYATAKATTLQSGIDYVTAKAAFPQKKIDAGQLQQSGVRATLVSARMPAKAAKPGRVAAAAGEAEGGWVVLSSPEEEGAAPRVEFAVSQETGKSYAAVEVENGWLVFQL